MKTLLLKSRIESDDSIRIHDEIILGMLDSDNMFCVRDDGIMQTLEFLVASYIFPIIADNAEQYEVVDYLVGNQYLYDIAEFYPYEEPEF
jgi:hypothetical protein